MKTIVDIDECLLREAEQQARREGKTFAALVEDALRSLVQPSPSAPRPVISANAPGLEADDPFFSALDEIRTLGRIPAPGREVKLD